MADPLNGAPRFTLYIELIARFGAAQFQIV